jgi:hypothetical protein
VRVGSTPSNAELVHVPHGGTPVVDGKVDDAAWSAAHSVSLGDGARVRMLHDGRYLFLAFEEAGATGWGFGVLYVAREKEILVLHASAQIGSAVYRPNDAGTWSPEASRYAWKPAQQLLKEEGWYANVATEGGADAREFAVRLDLVRNAPVALAYVRQEGENGRVVRTLPIGLRDGAADMRLIEGHNPDGLAFDPAKWVRLSIER